MSIRKYITTAEPVVFILSCMFFGVIIALQIGTDIQLHARSIPKFVDGSLTPPANFGYYLLVYATAFFKTDSAYLYPASIFVLASAVTAKFSITRTLSIVYFKENTNQENVPNRTPAILSFLLFFAFNLPTRRFYFGQIPPNVWHNSTTITVMPFALALFWLSYKQLLEPSRGRCIAIAVLCVANVLIKPSYFFVFGLVYPLILLKQFGLKRRFWTNLIPVAVGASITVAMYFLIFRFGFGNIHNGNSSIALRPLAVWSRLSSNIPLSLLMSLVFPISYFALYWRDVGRELLIQYASLSYIVAVLIFSFFSEVGPRELHGNFFWQCVICSYILFFVLILHLHSKVKRFGIRNVKNILISMAFLAHVVSGFAYIFKILITKRY